MVGEDKGDILKPLLIESTVNNKNAFKKKEVGQKKNPQLFSGIITIQCQEQEPALCISREQEENSFSDNLMGKGPVKARSLSITTIIIIVGSSCRRRAV